MTQKPSPLQTLALGLLLVILSACSTQAEVPPKTERRATPRATGTPVPTETASPTPTAIRTPPALPDIFISEHLNPVDTPYTYIDDTCEYLKNRWSPDKAKPGTVVMLVMLNSITKGSAASSDSMTVNQFNRMIENVQEQGFEAINTQQLLGFLKNNDYIPPRSILFLQDGRRAAGNYEKNFRPMWNESGWPVANGWIIQPESPDILLEENLALEKEGFVDHQLFSPLQRYSDNASEEFLVDELTKYIDIFEERYEKAPTAIIWPGQPGENFIPAARNLRFELGFTQNTRGPVMYNWIPLAAYEDGTRPAYYPEGPYEDPLMTLPRYWPLQVKDSLDQVRLVGKFAAKYAEEVKETELGYYDIVCAPEYGEISDTP